MPYSIYSDGVPCAPRPSPAAKATLEVAAAIPRGSRRFLFARRAAPGTLFSRARARLASPGRSFPDSAGERRARGERGFLFGYIRPVAPDLYVRENTLYRGVYCGLCRALGRAVGHAARLTLSYDGVFLALLLAALRGESFRVAPGRCGLKFYRRRPIAAENSSLRDAAAATAILTAYKIEDERADERGLHRLAARLALPLARRARRRAEAALPDKALGEALSSGFAALDDAERAGEGAEPLADRMGEILRALFAACAEDPVERDVLGQIGFSLGRWVYLLDAVDDYSEDRRRNRFNPFKSLPDSASLRAALNYLLEPVRALLDKLRPAPGGEDILGILRNILNEGMPAKAEEILAKIEERPGADPQ